MCTRGTEVQLTYIPIGYEGRCYLPEGKPKAYASAHAEKFR